MEEERKRDRILNALRVIRQVCKESNPDGNGDRCAECPLARQDGRCAITWDVPAVWKLNGDPGPWRAIQGGH